MLSIQFACEKFHKVLDSPAQWTRERPLNTKPGSENRSPSSSFAGAGAAAGMGLQFAISVLLFLFAGQWLDRTFGTAPLFLMLFVFIGAGASFYSIYRRLMNQQKRQRDERLK